MPPKPTLWKRLTSAQAAVLAALIPVMPPAVAGIAAFLGAQLAKPKVVVVDREAAVRDRIAARLGSRPSYTSAIYAAYGFGVLIPTGWTNADALTRVGTGQVNLIHSYTETNASLGVELKLNPVLPKYANDFNSEVANQTSPWKENYQEFQLRDGTLAARPAKVFSFVAKFNDGLIENRVYWIRLTPNIKLQVWCTFKAQAPNRDQYWAEVEVILQSIIVDDEMLKPALEYARSQ